MASVDPQTSHPIMPLEADGRAIGSVKKFTGAQHLIIFICMELLIYFDRGVLSQLLTQASDKFNITNHLQEGILAGGFMLGYVVGSPFFARLAQKGSAWTVYSILIGLSIWTMATALTYFVVSDYASLLVMRIITGVGEASFCSLAPPIIDDSAPLNKKAAYMGYFFMNIYVGQALGFSAGGLFSTWDSGSILFLFEAAIMIPLILFVFFFRSRFVILEHESEVAGRGLSQLKKIFSIPSFTLMALGYTFFMFAVGGLAFWGPTFLKEVWKVSNFVSGMGFGAMTALCGVFATGLGGLILDRLVRRHPDKTSSTRAMLGAKTSMWLTAGGLALTIIVPWTPNGALFFVFMAPAEFLLFASTAPINIAIMCTVPEALRGQAVAFSTGLAHILGDALSPLVIGWLRNDLNDRVVMTVATLFLLPGCVAWFLAARVVVNSRGRSSSRGSNLPPPSEESVDLGKDGGDPVAHLASQHAHAPEKL